MPDTPKGLQLANNVTELTAIAPLKPGRADELRLLFDDRKRREMTGEESSPIEQIESIHYARWVILDGGTRLLFTSNFDGNLEDYLAEFAERDEGPLNAIFRNCEGWPGARPVGPFIEYVRKHMVPAAYYYSAYPRHTVKEIKRALYWKQETEELIERLLPDLADLVIAVRDMYSNNPQAKQYLESHNFSISKFDTIRETLREFLRNIAQPTPDNIGKTVPEEVQP